MKIVIITVKPIVKKIEENMNKWKSTHSTYHARQVLALVNAFSTLYENKLITQHSYDLYKDYVYSYLVEVTQYYKIVVLCAPFKLTR